MTCTGNGAEFCGGSDRLNLFNNTAYIYPGNPQVVNSYVYQGCYHEGTNGRLLSAASYTDDVGMTVESCTAFCAENMPNGVYAGVEYSHECYCAATLPAGAVAEPDSDCNMLCRGNDKEYCGGSSLLNIYEYSTLAKRTRRKNKIRGSS
jgi:hypothetical protein